MQEAIYQAQQSQQEARGRGQSRRKPNMQEAKINGLVYTPSGDFIQYKFWQIVNPDQIRDNQIGPQLVHTGTKP